MRWASLLPLLLCAFPGAAAGAPLRPFPQHLTYAAGTIAPSQFTQAQTDADVCVFYDQWKADYLVALNTTPAQARIAFGKTGPAHDQTVSEGQGYGMLIVAHMAGYDAAAQEIFDALWRFVRAHPSVVDARLMGYLVPSAPGDPSDSAFDGDADIAYALLLADAQWGSAGAIDYAGEAQTLLTAIEEATIGPQSRLPLLGDWVNPDGAGYNEFSTRSSDFVIGHFRAFRRATGDPVWDEVVAATQKVARLIRRDYSPKTGLLPDFIVRRKTAPHGPKPAPPRFLESAHDGHHHYNACRDPWRIGTDALLNADPVSLAHARKLTGWIVRKTGGDPQRIRAGYRLDGSTYAGAGSFTSVFAAPFAVAAMCDPTQQAWLDDLYAAVRTRHEDYYEDSVNLLCLLVLAQFLGPDPPP